VNKTPWKRYGAAAGLVATGLVAGGILAGTLSASADEGTTSTDGPSSQSSADPSQPQRSGEELLTGETGTQVEEAVLAEYPAATIERTETDSEGVYESHIVTADDEHLIVQVGADFTVTGTDGGHGDGHGDGPDDDAGN
jgi:hypothetical protein